MTLPQFSSTVLQIPRSSEPSFTPTAIDGLFAFQANPRVDERGFFTELGKIPQLDQQLAAPFTIRQINHAHSKQFVTRGFHAEDWNKFITVVRGLAFVAIADIRPDSPTFGRILTALLGQQADFEHFVAQKAEWLLPHFQFDQYPLMLGSLFLPKGVANSVCVLSPDLDYLYGVDKLYEDRDPQGDVAVSLFDKTLGVEWPIAAEKMIISDRDKTAVDLASLLTRTS